MELILEITMTKP